ncbi:unnamed protein product [Rotaria sp. Silwood2]|nr:unnamed protein product [Rotaria sp. Silwood2]CAF4246485.1 unnamed protein product [Rotaria sp. Silwood2]
MVRTEWATSVRNVMSIWYHDKNISKDVLRQIKIHLYKTFPYMRIFDNLKDLTDYLAKKLVTTHFVFIISVGDKKKATAIKKLVAERPQFQSSYETKLEDDTSSMVPNLASVRSKMEKIFGKIISDLKNLPGINSNSEENINNERIMHEPTINIDTFKSISAQNSFVDLDTQSLKFLLFQSLIEMLVTMTYQEKAFNHLWDLCSMNTKISRNDEKNIQRIRNEYQSNNPIYHYTQSSFLFRLINQVFRLEDVENIFRFGCLLADLYKQLEKLAKKQNRNKNTITEKFYRGKRFSTEIVQQFKDHVNHLISMNGLFSTTESPDVRDIFSGSGEVQGDYHSVEFEINIEPATTNLIRPYANVREVSAIQDDDEVLFFMGFVWKIVSMTETSSNHWHIILQSCKDYDPQLITYIEEARRNCTYLSIGNILRELGDYSHANNFYQRMLKETMSVEIRADVYFQMAILEENRGEYMTAQVYYEQAVKLFKPRVTNDKDEVASSKPLFSQVIGPTRAQALNNLGRIYFKDGDYEDAENHFKKALEENLISDVERASVLNNYGLLEFKRSKYEEAGQYFDLAIQHAQNDACSADFKRNYDVTKQRIENQNK